MGGRARAIHWPPLRVVGLRCERGCVGVVVPTASPVLSSECKETAMRSVALDVHLDFCEVAIVEDGELRSAGRIETKPEQIELFAGSLAPDDRVALEVTGNAWEIARLIEPHVAQVLVVSPSDTGIRQARAKTDRLDARTLTRLLAAGAPYSVRIPARSSRLTSPRLPRRDLRHPPLPEYAQARRLPRP